jgi:hypothetical protein
VTLEELRIGTLELGEQWRTTFSPEELDAVIEMCELQADRFRQAAFDVTVASLKAPEA